MLSYDDRGEYVRAEPLYWRALAIREDDVNETSWLWESPSALNCQIEIVGEEADILQLLRRRDFDIVVSSPTTPGKSDIVRLSEMLRIRPGLRLILHHAPPGERRTGR